MLTLLIPSYLAAALVKLLDKYSSGNDSRYNLVVCSYVSHCFFFFFFLLFLYSVSIVGDTEGSFLSSYVKLTSQAMISHNLNHYLFTFMSYRVLLCLS